MNTAMQNKIILITAVIGITIGFTVTLYFRLLQKENATKFQQEELHVVSQVHAAEITPQPKKFAKVTAYTCGGLVTVEQIKMNCPSLLKGSPKTATGTTPVPYKTVACDKSNMGKRFFLEGVGEVKCEDRGGAIKGSMRFDLYVTNLQEAQKWGVKTIEYREL